MRCRKWSRVGVLVLLCLLAGWGYGQVSPPAGGYRLREVKVLRPVPEPPGGLVPFRQGKLWGYADTTGRIIIAPQLEYYKSSETSLLVAGFAEIGNGVPDKFTRRLHRKPRLGKPWYRAVFINARGELLLVRLEEAALLQADGSLVKQKRQRVIGQTEQHPPKDNASREEHPGFQGFGPRRVVAYESRPSNKAIFTRTHLHFGGWLGQNRLALANRMVHGGPRFRPDHEIEGMSLRQLTRYENPQALTTQHGRRLTRFRFNEIHPFSQGLARTRMLVFHGNDSIPQEAESWGYINLQGRWHIRPRFTDASDFRAGYAVVEVNGEFGYFGRGQYGVIDHAGRYTYPPRPGRPSREPDEAGFVRRRLHDSTHVPPIRAQLLPPPGTAFSGDSVYDGAGAFTNGRAWVRQGRRHGLIDRQGHWLTSPEYDLLLAPRTLRTLPAQLEAEAEYENFWVDSPSVSYYEIPHTYRPYGDPTYPAQDTAYLLVRRAGRYGFVARHSGREVVPCRYDQILFNLHRGFGCAERNGTAYVVSAQGQELVAAYYTGIDFKTVEGRLLYLRRPQEATWALMDTTGRLRTVWLPGNGYPVAGGWHLSREGSRYTVRDATGRLAYSSIHPIQHYDFADIWAGMGREQQAGMVANVPFMPAWELHWEQPQPAGRVFFLVTGPDTTRLLDIKLREIGRCPHPLSPYQSFNFKPLRHGWHALPVPGAKLLPTDGYQLLADTGELLPLLPDNSWEISPGYDYSRLYHERGLLLTTKGFMTRQGRPFWKD